MNKPYLIGISGGSASGKTFFLQQLIQRLGDQDLCIISQDEYYKPRDQQLKDPNGVTNFDLPEAIDYTALQEDLQRIMSGETILKQEYTFNNPARIPQQLVYRPARIVIVEGIFLLHYENIRQLFDLTVFLQSSREIKSRRRLQRDVVERGYDEQHILYTQTAHVDVAYKEFIKPYRRNADLVINNNERGFEKGLDVLVNHIKANS